MTEQTSGGSGERDHFIPARKTDVLDALFEHGALATEAERDKFRQLCRQLGAIYHYEYFDQLERLRNDYHYFSPELESGARFDPAKVEASYRDLIDALLHVLEDANFIEISHDEIGQAHRKFAMVRVNTKARLDDYREVRFFRRGHHKETVEISRWFGWRKRSIEVDVYDDVVLLMATKSGDRNAGGSDRTRNRRAKVHPGTVLLKYFHSIASADLNTLFPDVRVVMGLRDRLMLGLPALVGGVPILLKLASTLAVLFLVGEFYLGMTGTVRDSDMAGALAAISGLIALGGFIAGQWVRFQRQSLLYHKVLADNVYYRNVNNNAGIFDTLIRQAEEQECKEAFLAYYFLLAPDSEATEGALDARIEAWLRQTFAANIDFKSGEALSKLDRHGLLRRNGDRLSVLPLGDALQKLDRVWGNFFPPDGAK